MLKRNLFFNSLLSVSQILFPLITFPYSSRILGPHGIGSINFIDSITQYFILFAALGIPLYGVREVSRHKSNPEELNKVFSEILLVHFRSAAVFSIIYLVIALLVPSLRIHIDLVLIGIVILIFNVLSGEWLFAGLERFSYIASRTLIVKIISIIFLFVFLKKDSSPNIYYAIMASSSVIVGVLNLIFIKKHVKLQFKNLELKKHIRPLITILSSTIAVSVYLIMDNILLGFLKGETAVGIYSTAMRIIRLPLSLILSIGAIIAPQVSIAFSNSDETRIRTLIHKSFSFLCVVALPIIIGIYVSASFLIHTFAGDKFTDAIIVLRILAPLLIMNGMGNIFCLQLLAPMQNEKYLLKSMVIGMIFNLLTNIVLIYYFSFIGAAIGYMLTEFVATFVSYYYVKKTIAINFDLKIFSQCLLGSIIIVPIAYVLRNIFQNHLISEVIVILTSVAFYVLYVWFFIENIYITNMKTILRSKLNFMYIQVDTLFR